MNFIPDQLHRTGGRWGGAVRFAVVLLAVGVLAVLIAGCRTSSNAPAPKTAELGRGASTRKKPVAKPAPVKANTTPKSAQGQAQAAPPPPDAGPLIDFQQSNITLRWVEKGVVRMSATAKEGRMNELTKTGLLTDFSAKLYENGKLSSTMTAPKVVADTANRIVTANGGVTMRSVERNTVVDARWVKWYAKQQKVIGGGGVTIKSDAWDLKSSAFVADTGLKTLTLKNSSKGLVPQ